MAKKKAVVFVDGENLVMRYQEMLAAGRVPRTGISHEPDCFVWSPLTFSAGVLDLVRINYYTHVVGDDDKVTRVTNRIAATTYTEKYFANEGAWTHLIPRVHKKSARSTKTKVVDVDVTMDVMRAALTMPIDVIVLLSGDGDYAPLIREVARSTSKQVLVHAFSSGLAEQLRSCAEAFELLDDNFFEEGAPR